MRKLKGITGVVLSMIVLAALVWHAGSAHSQAYPNKVIRVIIPAAAGDSCDVLARLVGQKVSERLGQQLTIDNRPGAGGQLGLMLLTQAAPDGYTIACGQGGNMVIVPLAYQKVAYDTFKDFAPVALMASIPTCAKALWVWAPVPRSNSSASGAARLPAASIVSTQARAKEL